MLVWNYDCKSYYAAYNENLVNDVTANKFHSTPLYNETLRACFTVGVKKKYQKNDECKISLSKTQIFLFFESGNP